MEVKIYKMFRSWNNKSNTGLVRVRYWAFQHHVNGDYLDFQWKDFQLKTNALTRSPELITLMNANEGEHESKNIGRETQENAKLVTALSKQIYLHFRGLYLHPKHQISGHFSQSSKTYPTSNG